ncbi:MAG: hypothetical protein ACHQCF_07105 [Solirubrobacterales bacterium]
MDLQAILPHIDDEAEGGMRHGTFRGPDKWVSDFEAQMKTLRLEIEIEEIIDAADDALILYPKVLRKSRESEEVSWKAWPANVDRVHQGKFVFFEGYVDRRQALADLGVARS